MTVIVRRCHFVIRMSLLENDKDGFFGLCALVSGLVRHMGLLIRSGGSRVAVGGPGEGAEAPVKVVKHSRRGGPLAELPFLDDGDECSDRFQVHVAPYP